MAISIQPVAILLIIIVISNCFISFGKSNLLNKSYILLSSVLSLAGIVGIITTRPRLIESLYKNASRGEFDSDFVTWAIEKFDSFAVISMIATCLITIFLTIHLFLTRNKRGFVWTNITGTVIFLMIINFLAGVWYSLGTINILFDVAGYISNLTVSEFFALHIPLIVKRILIGKREA
ncbi:hypothetical protein DP73_12775 [Desulfosporosinus sp. HMP52]|uniref:hypothetical protein n=1 Tax=Desulfosporosinus sp. HMP52 TaxID=1487923 RepID=UPI00051FEF67|nr:hypothetical protein [Desulfosporosinus sp. HMP52]KGK88362.1 hypothetical protein DP73_12775 [Desulfosporosinus sp. HMP52]